MLTTAHLDTFARDQLPPRQAWPEMPFSLPQLQYPQQLNCVTALLDDAVASIGGERIALYSARDRWSYGHLQQVVNQIAQVLREDMKLVPGNRVLLRGENALMTAACFLAILKAGCIVVPTMPMLRAKELQEVLDKAQVNAVLCSQALCDELEAANQRLARPAAIMHFHHDAPDSLEARIRTK